MIEASQVAEAELRRYEANRPEQPLTGGHCVLQAMKPEKSGVIAQECDGSDSTTPWSLGNFSPKGRRTSRLVEDKSTARD